MAFDLQVRPWVFWTSVASALAAIYAICVIHLKRRSAQNVLPPGPKGIPFLGSLFQLSTTPWKDCENWKEQYGPLVYFTVAGQKYLVLNTHQVAGDLMDRRGHVYSDRPRFILGNEIFTRGLSLMTAKYGQTWKRMRRSGHEALNKGRIIKFYPTQSKEAVTAIDGMLRDPGAWEGEYRRAAASTVLSVIYDHPTVSSIDDSTVVVVNEFSDLGARYLVPGKYLVEFFTWMKYIPSSMAKWKREAEEGYKKYSKFFVDMFQEVEKRINQGDERPSFAGTLIRERKRHQLSDQEAAWLAASMYSAGAETTATTMTWFMLAMIAHPTKQRKCQEELDRIVGRSRMPTLEDRDSLPYLRATVQEALRWRPVVPVAVHSTTEDDFYQGLLIPKGTMCLGNVWSMNRDRTVYGEDADDFNPDRFIDEHGELSVVIPDTKNEGHLSYGLGPRICPGRYLANNSIFINIACILWAAEISAVKDEAGKPIIPDTLETIGTGLVIHPLPFDCVITPRFPEARAIVAQTKELLE